MYAAGVRHAYNLAEAFRAEGIKAQGVSGETPKRELANILARYERGEIDVLINAQLLAEGWNSPRATVCVHLAPTASKRIYQQRVGRVTRRNPGKEAGLVVDFVHPATKHDDPVVTLHSLLDRDVYRGGAIVVGPVRRGRGRRMRVERRVLPVCAEEERRFAVFERELWRIAVENLDYGEQHVWAALAGARVSAAGWRRARAMLHFDRAGELKSRFLITAVQRNPSPQLRLRALADIAAGRDADAFDTAIDVIGAWSREERREASKIMLRSLVERRIGRRDQASAWIWRLAEYTRELHEEYAVQRWPETKRLLGLLVNSSGGAHARNARRLIHASRKQDRRLAAALLAAALAHTPEAEEALRGARTRMARKPPALARELLRNFPKRRARNNKRNKRKGPKGAGGSAARPRPGTAGVPIPVSSEAESIAQAVSVAERVGESVSVSRRWGSPSLCLLPTGGAPSGAAGEHHTARGPPRVGGRGKGRREAAAGARGVEHASQPVGGWAARAAQSSGARHQKARGVAQGGGGVSRRARKSRQRCPGDGREEETHPRQTGRCQTRQSGQTESSCAQYFRGLSRRSPGPRGPRPGLLVQCSARIGAALVIDRIPPRAAWPTPTLASSSSTARMSSSTVSWLRYALSEIRPAARGSGRRSSAVMPPRPVEGSAAKSALSSASAGAAHLPHGPPPGQEPRVLCSSPHSDRRRAGAEAQGARGWHRLTTPLRSPTLAVLPAHFFATPYTCPTATRRAGRVRGYSSVGRAPGSHPGGRGFESP